MTGFASAQAAHLPTPLRRLPNLLNSSRLWTRITWESSDCWIWTGGRNAQGYGVISLTAAFVRYRYPAHRVLYERLIGPIPEGLQLDHLCRVHACVRPDHLEPVTNRENTMRGNAPMAVVARTGVCPRGHSLADAFTVKSGPQVGRRNCRPCTQERVAKARAISNQRARVRWAEQAADPAFRAKRAAYERARKARLREASR